MCSFTDIMYAGGANLFRVSIYANIAMVVVYSLIALRLSIGNTASAVAGQFLFGKLLRLLEYSLLTDKILKSNLTRLNSIKHKLILLTEANVNTRRLFIVAVNILAWLTSPIMVSVFYENWHFWTFKTITFEVFIVLPRVSHIWDAYTFFVVPYNQSIFSSELASTLLPLLLYTFKLVLKFF